MCDRERPRAPPGARPGVRTRDATVGVSCEQLSRRTPCAHRARSQSLRPEGVRRSAPVGTAAGSILPFRRGNCGAANERTSYGSPYGTTQVQVPAGEGGSGVPPPTQVRRVARPRPRGSLATFPPAAETRTLTASTRLPAPAAAAVLPALLRVTPGSQTLAPGHRLRNHPPPGDCGPRNPRWGSPRATRRPGPPHRKLVST